MEYIFFENDIFVFFLKFVIDLKELNFFKLLVIMLMFLLEVGVILYINVFVS